MVLEITTNLFYHKENMWRKQTIFKFGLFKRILTENYKCIKRKKNVRLEFSKHKNLMFETIVFIFIPVCNNMATERYNVTHCTNTAWKTIFKCYHSLYFPDFYISDTVPLFGFYGSPLSFTANLSQLLTALIIYPGGVYFERCQVISF